MSHEAVHILLVEDDEVDIEALRRAMRKERIANPVTVAHDGIEALAALRGDGCPRVPRPYVILLDLNMPRMNGLEFIEAVRADPEIADSVVFVMTTSKADEDRAAAYAHHVAGFMHKQDLADGFRRMVQMLGGYWKLVTLP